MNATPPLPQRATHSGGHGGHGWMMMICCIPMIIIAVVLVATGVASPSFLLAAFLCTAMMALMMRGMNHLGDAADTQSSSPSHDHDHHRSPSA